MQKGGRVTMTPQDMTPHDITSDDTDRAALRRLLTDLDPVPAEVVAAAKASLTWRTIDAELAELAYDSLLDAELVGTRGAVATRSISFEYGANSIEIEVEAEHSAGQHRIVGQIAPQRPTSMELQRSDGAQSIKVAVDDRGRFTIGNLAPGMVRLFVEFAPGSGSSRLLTEWMSI